MVIRTGFIAALTLALSSCGSGVGTVGGKGVAGDYAAVVDLRPKQLDVVTVEVYEDFMCPACQHFSLETLPALKRRYGNALNVTVHYIVSPSMQPDALALYSIANTRGEGATVAQALLEAGLEHRVSAENEERVRQVARRFGLGTELQSALGDKETMKEIRGDWLTVAHKVAHLPFVEIQGEIATNGNRSNLEAIFDSLLRGPPPD
jgi:predicted DsbA family dithiol-disulfide isomerase